jgi:hypothetical protein
VITTTLETVPENATHWSTRTLAAYLGLSQTTISRIWRAFALAPHRTEGFTLSTDPYFVDKVRDIVGLYMHPSACAPALHAHLGFLDQLGGMLVLDPHGASAQAREVPLHSRLGERHPCLCGHQQHQSQTLRLDQDGRSNPSVRCRVLYTDFRFTPLAVSK